MLGSCSFVSGEPSGTSLTDRQEEVLLATAATLDAAIDVSLDRTETLRNLQTTDAEALFLSQIAVLEVKTLEECFVVSQRRPLQYGICEALDRDRFAIDAIDTRTSE